MFWRLFSLIFLFSCSVQAAGPSVVAKLNQTLWQHPINTIEQFDTASRALILLYASELKQMSNLSDAEMKTEFKIKTVNKNSLQTWLAKEQNLIIKNYQNAAKTCQNDDWTCVKTSSFDELSNQSIPDSLSNAKTFVHHYLAEQLRLAALFPDTSSEILTFNTNEWTGDE